MAYQPCRCSVTLLCPVCISVFYTPLALFVLLPFMLYVPYHFNAPFLDCAFLLLCSASLYTPEFSYTATTLISSLFSILIVYVVFVHVIFAMPLHAHSTQNSSTTWVLYLIIIVTLQLLWLFSTRSASLYVILRFLSLSGNLRLFVFSVTVKLTFFVLVTGLNSHPTINRLHEHIHPSWIFPKTLHLLCQSPQSVFESSGRNHQWFLEVTLFHATVALRSCSNSPTSLDWLHGILHSFWNFGIWQFSIHVNMCLTTPSRDPRKGAWLL